WRVPSARRASAASSSPWTVRALGWIWNPAKSVPSYSTRARYRDPGARTPSRAFMWWLLDQLDLDDRGRVALAQPDPHDPGVPGRPVGVLRGDLVEQIRHDVRLVREGRHDGAPRRQVVPLGDRDHPLDPALDLLGLRLGRLDPLVAEHAHRQVLEQRQPRTLL